MIYDNTNNFTATLNGCSQKTQDIENLGLHTFISEDTEGSSIVIDSSDFGGIGTFIGDNNQYFIIKYMGKMPKITYEYFFDEESQSKIFEIDPSGEIFGELIFVPNDDTALGAQVLPVQMAMLNSSASIEDQTLVSNTFAIHSFVGEMIENKTASDYIGICAYTSRGRVVISKSLGDGLTLGSVKKRIVLSLSPTTKMESFSFGTRSLFNTESSMAEDIDKPISLNEMMEESRYSGYHESIRTFQKITFFLNLF